MVSLGAKSRIVIIRVACRARAGCTQGNHFPYDDIFVIGYGSDHVRQQTTTLAAPLRQEGALVSPKSTLDPRPDIRWICKDFDFSAT